MAKLRVPSGAFDQDKVVAGQLDVGGTRPDTAGRAPRQRHWHPFVVASLHDQCGQIGQLGAIDLEVGPGVGKGGGGLSTLTWGDFLRCQGLGAVIGVDCWGVAQPAVRYDSPTWGGFRFETSYGKNQVTGYLSTPKASGAATSASNSAPAQ